MSEFRPSLTAGSPDPAAAFDTQAALSTWGATRLGAHSCDLRDLRQQLPHSPSRSAPSLSPICSNAPSAGAGHAAIQRSSPGAETLVKSGVHHEASGSSTYNSHKTVFMADKTIDPSPHSILHRNTLDLAPQQSALSRILPHSPHHAAPLHHTPLHSAPTYPTPSPHQPSPQPSPHYTTSPHHTPPSQLKPLPTTSLRSPHHPSPHHTATDHTTHHRAAPQTIEYAVHTLNSHGNDAKHAVHSAIPTPKSAEPPKYATQPSDSEWREAELEVTIGSNSCTVCHCSETN